MAPLRNSTLILAAMFVSSSPLGAAESADDLAKALINKAGMTHGIAALPRTGDGKLALAVVQNSKFLVHAMSTDRKQVDAMIQLADGAGILAKSLYVEQGLPAALPYADNFVDLILITDVADMDLAGIPAKEILRVLAPSRGRAIIGRAKTAGGTNTLSKAALETWAQGLAVANPKVEEDASGLWVVCRKPAEAGADAWSHRYHGPGNNPVSADTTVKAPLITQWLGLPLHDGWWGTAIVSAGGRMFTIWAARDMKEAERLTLTARDLHNGSILWERPFQAEKVKYSYNPARCCMVATDENFYLVDGDGVLVLDAETGVEKTRIKGPKADGQIKWMALENGVLALLVGEKDKMEVTHLMAYPSNPQGTLLAAYNPTDGKQLWQQETPAPVDERMIAVNGGKLYGHATGVRTFCLDLKTGKQEWANSEASLLEVADSRIEKAFDQAILSQRGLIATDQALILGTRWHKQLAALSPQTGGILSMLAPGGARTTRGFMRDGKWYSGGDMVDPATGKSLGSKRVPGDGCGPSTAAPALLISCFGQAVDADSGKVAAAADIKSPCDMGTLVSEGLIVTPPSVCRCNLPLWGYRAITSAAGVDLAGKTPMEGRLLSQAQEPPPALAVTAADWPTYRANNARTGAVAVQAPTTAPSERWHWQPAKPVEYTPSPSRTGSHTSANPDFSPTAPIAAAGKVWFGDASGIIRCLDAASGKLLWSFPTAAKLFAPPSLAGGRLYVGSGDGWIYCLDATGGRERWRFQAAPSDRRTLWYGHLVSTWPVVTGVLVQDGVAYAAAGYQGMNGVHVYALDAESGQVRWENHDAGADLNGRGGTGAMGALTIAQGRLWMASGYNFPVSFDLKTGSLLPAPAAKTLASIGRTAMRGCEVGVFADNLILYGGRRLAAGYEERSNPGQGTGFSFLGLKDNSGEPTADLLLLPNSTLPPVWDNELTVVGRTYNSNLQGWNTPKVTTALQQALGKGAPGRVELPEYTWNGRPATAPAPALLWNGPKYEASALAMATNVVLVGHVQAGKGLLAGLDRDKGAELWSVKLPSELIFNGLALDRQGRVLVVLRDGSLVCYGLEK